MLSNILFVLLSFMTLTFTGARRTPIGLENAFQVAFIFTINGDPHPHQLYIGAMGVSSYDPASLDKLEQTLFGAALGFLRDYYQREHMLPDETLEYWQEVDFTLDQTKSVRWQDYTLELP